MEILILNEVRLDNGLILKVCPECNDVIKEGEVTEEHGLPFRYLYHTNCWHRALEGKIACDQIDYGEERELQYEV